MAGCCKPASILQFGSHLHKYFYVYNSTNFKSLLNRLLIKPHFLDKRTGYQRELVIGCDRNDRKMQ